MCIRHGLVPPEVARYHIEVEQGKDIWRTDAVPRQDVSLTITSENGKQDGEISDNEGDTIALAVGITGPIAPKVRRYLAQRQEKIAALLILEKESTAKRIQSAGEAVAIARLVKRHAKAFVDHWHAKKLLFFFYGPAGLACIVGHQFNAIGANIQIMEEQTNTPLGYAPSFLLS